MSCLHSSQNYVWYATSVLGQGSMGSVFQGFNKNTGESVAVKTFKPHNFMVPLQVQMREFEALKKVNHENVVKLLAIEEHLIEGSKVIIMELCTGGSLSNILEDPENSYGLPEKEFLLVLEHLCAGMKHLRDNKLVHRDLKPGNIMRFMSKDGQTIYKLTDFGTARELEDNQSFSSLHGTEEYLHPDLYGQFVGNFLQKPTIPSFAANVDLWSIGVTLYQVASGKLPFQPFGGRTNRATMHHITTKKASGVISGIQKSENGPIEWSTKLPAHCQLTAGLRELITPLLAGLLEENREKTWSFDRFFQEVTLILRKRVIHVFYVNCTKSLEIFLEPDEQIDNFRERIYLQTEAPHMTQMLLFNKEHLEKRVTPQTIALEFPKTTPESPIFLYRIDDTNVQWAQQLELPTFPVFVNNVSAEQEINLAKGICGVGHEYKRRVENFTSLDVLIKNAVEQFVETLNMTVTRLMKKAHNFDALLTSVAEYANVLQELEKMHKGQQGAKSLMAALDNLKTEFDGAMDLIYRTHKHFIVKNTLNDQWISLMHGKMCPCRTRASFQATHLVERLRVSLRYLIKYWAVSNPTINQKQFHALEKIKIDRYVKGIKSLLLDDVQPVVSQMVESLADWYKLAQTVHLKTEILEKDVRDSELKLNGIRDELDQWKNELNLDANAKLYSNKRKCLQEVVQKLQHHEPKSFDILRESKDIMDKLQNFDIDDKKAI